MTYKRSELSGFYFYPHAHDMHRHRRERMCSTQSITRGGRVPMNLRCTNTWSHLQCLHWNSRHESLFSFHRPMNTLLCDNAKAAARREIGANTLPFSGEPYKRDTDSKRVIEVTIPSENSYRGYRAEAPVLNSCKSASEGASGRSRAESRYTTSAPLHTCEKR